MFLTNTQQKNDKNIKQFCLQTAFIIMLDLYAEKTNPDTKSQSYVCRGLKYKKVLFTSASTSRPFYFAHRCLLLWLGIICLLP